MSRSPNRHVPQPASLDPIELAVWSAEFVRARNNTVEGKSLTIDRTDFAIDQAIVRANEAVEDLRKAYKR